MTCKQRGDIPLRDQNPLPRNFFLWGPRNYLSTLQSATVLLNSDCKYKMDCVKTPLISMPWLLRDSCCYRVSTLSSSPIFVFFLTQHSLTRCRCRRSAEIANNAHKQVTPPPPLLLIKMAAARCPYSVVFRLPVCGGSLPPGATS